MKKLSVLVLAVLAVAVFGAVAAAGPGDVKKVETKVSIKFNPGGGGPYAETSFSGEVKAKKGCEKERKVTVKRVGGAKVGSDTSSSNGSYEVSVGSDVADGNYFAKADKRKIEKDNGTVIRCKKGSSDTISAP